MPGTVLVDGVVLSPGSARPLPFLLQFDCGVPAFGTLFVSVDTVDGFGTAGVARVSVPLVDH